MRILIDYFSLVYALGGIRKYIENILQQIAELDSKNEYMLLDFKNQAREIFSLNKPNFKIKNSNLLSPKLYKKLAFMLKFPPLDFFHDFNRCRTQKPSVELIARLQLSDNKAVGLVFRFFRLQCFM